MKFAHAFGVAAVAMTARAQQPEWAQCGGIGWTGSTTCVSPFVCTFNNAYYSQCLPGSSSASTTAMHTTTTTTAAMQTTTLQVTTTLTTTLRATTTTTSAQSQGTGFQWFGVNESGAEFGQGKLPGVWGTDFIFPSNTSIQTLIGQGFNIFRVPFLLERMAPNGLTGPLSPSYLANYSWTIDYITSAGAYAIVDPHNFGRYNGNIISDTAGFQSFWNTLASNYKSNSLAVFDTNNEYHDMDQTLVLNLNQAAINGIRAAGATSQYIFVEGNSWTGAWTWATTNGNLAALTDPSNKIIYEMHQYLDSDGSGTSATCVNSTIGFNRVQSATQWLIQNNKRGIIGEFAGGANSVCQSAVTGMLTYMQQNSNVWAGAIWWGGGPWWGNYIFSFEPPSGTGYSFYDTTLKSYVP